MHIKPSADPSHLLLDGFEPQHWHELDWNELNLGALTLRTGGGLVCVPVCTVREREATPPVMSRLVSGYTLSSRRSPLPPSSSVPPLSPLLSSVSLLLFALDTSDHRRAVVSQSLRLPHVLPVVSWYHSNNSNNTASTPHVANIDSA